MFMMTFEIGALVGEKRCVSAAAVILADGFLFLGEAFRLSLDDATGSTTLGTSAFVVDVAMIPESLGVDFTEDCFSLLSISFGRNVASNWRAPMGGVRYQKQIS